LVEHGEMLSETDYTRVLMLTTLYPTLGVKCGYVAACKHIPVPATSEPGRNCEPVTIGLLTGSNTRANGTFGGDARRRAAHRGLDIENIVDSSNVQYSTYIKSLTIHISYARLYAYVWFCIARHTAKTSPTI
jgi:hypothetical protein